MTTHTHPHTHQHYLHIHEHDLASTHHHPATYPLLSIRDLSVRFTQYERGLRQITLETVSSLSLSVDVGEVLAVVGASGSGKSLLAQAILGILPANARISGKMTFQGQELTAQRQQQLRGREIAFVPQSVDYLDPLMKVGRQVQGVRNSRQQQQAVFERYGLAPFVAHLYPFQLSGGMLRRVLIACAVIEDVSLIIADEPTPGLSHAAALEVMRHFRELADEGRAVLIITHDINLAFDVADSIAVFYAGTIFEHAPMADFIAGPDALRHPYTKALYRALPKHGFKPHPGTQPYAGALPAGCLYAKRCEWSTPECEQGTIEMRALRGGMVRCIHAL
ncbi:MAG: ABC transporter ATP-binding protein [Coriobacteriales bacterium]|jgi:peptide/nickel transport system ATP-binding protein|nr:ABC transporter ATP-binding protein [Coriobacteriales bacterium]